MVYRILSIDGGGVRGVFALGVLQLILDEIDPHFLEKIDCFAGTSAGAVIVSALSQGYTPKELIWCAHLLGWRTFSRMDQEDNGKAMYSHRWLEKLLKIGFFNKPTLADVKQHLIIPACPLATDGVRHWGFEIYDNFDREKAKKWNLADTVLKSAAAPIYFPSYQGCIDGGVYAINPSMIAFGKAIDPKGGNQSISDVRLLSIGMGINPVNIQEETDWCASKWMSPYGTQANYTLFSLVTEIASHGPDYPLTQILKEQYLRINKILPEPIELDQYKKTRVLSQCAKELKGDPLWPQQKEWIRKNILL